MCSCNFNDDNIVEEAFSCRASTVDPSLKNTVVYRAKVTPQVPVSMIDANDIVQIIGDWVQSAPSITVNRLIINIDPNCPITLESFDAEDCSGSVITTTSSSVQLPLPTIRPSSADNSKSSTGVIVGATIGAIVIVILAMVVVVLTVLHCRLKSNYR